MLGFVENIGLKHDFQGVGVVQIQRRKVLTDY